MVEEIDSGTEGINGNCNGRTVRKNRLIKTAKTSTKIIASCIVVIFLLNNFVAMAQNSENTQEIDVENDLPWTHTWTSPEQVTICLKNVNGQKNLLLKFENPVTSELVVNNEVFDTIENGTTNIFIFVINNATALNFQVEKGTKLTIENISGARINCNSTRITGWTFQNQYGKYVSEIGIPTDSAHEITITPLSYPSLWPFPIRPPHIRPKPLPITYMGLMNNSIAAYGIAESETTVILQKGTDCLKLVSDKPVRFTLTITPKHFEPVDYAIYENGNATLTLDKELFWEILEHKTIPLDLLEVSHDLKMAIQQLDKAYKETEKNKYDNANIWLSRAVNNLTHLYETLDERHIGMKYQSQMIIEYLNGIGNITVNTKDMVLHRINKSMDYLSYMFLYLYNPSIRVKSVREKLEKVMGILEKKNTGSLDDVINCLNKTISLLDYIYLDEDDENNIMIQQPVFILYWLEMTKRNIDAIVENENIKGVNGAVNLLQNVIEDLQDVVNTPTSEEEITAIVEELENIDYNDPPSGIDGILNMIENLLEHLDDCKVNVNRLEKIEERLEGLEDDCDSDDFNVSFFQDEINQIIKELNEILVTISGIPVGFDVQTGYTLEDNDNDDVPKVTISLSDVWLKYQPSKLFATVDGYRKININHNYSIAFIKNSTIIVGDVDDNNADIPSIHPETINIGNVSCNFNLVDEDLDGFPVVIISIHEVKLVRHLEIIIIGEYGISSTDKKGYVPIDGFKPHPILVEYYEEEITETECLYESLESSDRNAAVPNPVADLDHDKLGNIGEVFMYRTDALDSDTDKDSLLDGDEVFYWNDLYRIYQDNNLKPNADIDNDGVSNVLDADSDNDGLIDGNEFLYKTLPFDNDADNDLIMDGAEINYWEHIVCLTVNETVEYINNPDVDNELLDGVELRDYFTYPFMLDSDDDTLTDKTEIDGWDVTITYMDASTFMYHTLSWPTYYDTDSDGLNDSYEFNLKTDPQKTDTDEEGLSDMEEVDGSWFISNPTMQDTDFDKLSDYEEKTGWIITVNSKTFRVYSHPQYKDFDRDMLDDYQEKQYGINPFSADTDSDNLTDKREIDGWDIVVNGAVTHVNSSACNKYSDNDNLDDWMEFRTGRTDPRNNDTDNDNLLDSDEIVVEKLPYGRISIRYITYPNVADCDNDDVLDGNEKDWNMDSDFDGLINALDKDSDNDGLDDGVEQSIGTNPTIKDSDNDGLNDKEEYAFWEGITTGLSLVDSDNDGLISILDSDSDNDGLLDGYERWRWGNTDNDEDGVIDILDDDSDNDMLLDGEEINVYNTNPLKSDTDDDGLSDYDELFVYKINPSLNPNNPDTDHDGINDKEEIEYWQNRRLSTNNAVKNTLVFDVDNDYIPDGWEIKNGYDPTDVNSGDLQVYSGLDDDNDGLLNCQEIGENWYNLTFVTEYTNVVGSLPLYPTFYNNSDSDNDGIDDGNEDAFWDNLGVGANNDSDNDGLPNIVDPDSDNDYLKDGEEKEYFENRATENIVYAPNGDYDNDSLINIVDPDSDNDGILDGEENLLYNIFSIKETMTFTGPENKTRYLKIPLMEDSRPVPIDNVSVYIKSAGGEGWSEEEIISQHEPGRYAGGYIGGIAVNSSNIHVIWYYSAWHDPQSGLYYKRSTDNGETWSPPICLTTQWCGRRPQIAVNGDTVHIVWGCNSGAARGNIWYMKSTNNGATWTTPVKIYQSYTGFISGDLHPSIATEGNTIHVAWGYLRFYWGYGVFTGVRYIKSTDNGVTWFGGKELYRSMPNVIYKYPSIAVSGNNVHVVWTGDFSSDSVWYVRSIDGGCTWSSATAIDGGHPAIGDDVYSPARITSDGNNIYILWSGGNSWSPNLYYRKSTDNGVSWGSSTLLAQNYVRNPLIATGGDYIHVVWTTQAWWYGGHSIGKIWYMQSADGVNWTEKTELANFSSSLGSSNVEMTAYDDDVYIVWLDKVNDEVMVYFMQTEKPAALNPSLIIGDDGIIEWSYSGEFNNSVVISPLEIVMKYLGQHSDMDDGKLDGYISIPITFRCDSGVLDVCVTVDIGGFEFSTDPLDNDTDNDGLLDGEEVNIWNTNPTRLDTDEDGLDDLVELQYWQDMGINPLNPVFDDGDLYINLLLDSDSDNDGLLDGNEYTLWENIQPGLSSMDSDQDGLINILDQDSDNDHLIDGEEMEYWGNRYNIDLDGDGKVNILDSDSDNDTLLDGIELTGWDFFLEGVWYHTSSDPGIVDTDNDWLDDYDEFRYGTNAMNQDTDFDMLSDYDEVEVYKTNPINPDSDYDTVDDKNDVNPLIDTFVSVKIKRIKALDWVDLGTAADFYVKVKIDGEWYKSSGDHIKEDDDDISPNIVLTHNVPDNKTSIDIVLQVWEDDDYVWPHTEPDDHCDISGTGSSCDITYDLRTGIWNGDDYQGDRNGYGYASGDEDGSTGTDEDDCALWFDVYQNDNDNDGLMYCEEVHTYGTDPTADNRGEDLDNDDIPIEWEDKWGYDPTIWDDHYTLDPDSDGLTNLEEYQVRNLGSDPYYPDLFVEIDYLTGHRPHDSVLNYVVEYYRTHPISSGYSGIHLVFDVDEEIQETSDNKYMTTQIFFNIKSNHFNFDERDGIYRYGLFGHKDSDGALGWAWAPGEDFFIADAECDDYANDWTNHWIGGVIDTQVEKVVLMHELGHNINIYDDDDWSSMGGDSDGRLDRTVWVWIEYNIWVEVEDDEDGMGHKLEGDGDFLNEDDDNDHTFEDYCDNSHCVMAKVNWDNCDDSPYYCSHHWAQADPGAGAYAGGWAGVKVWL